MRYGYPVVGGYRQVGVALEAGPDYPDFEHLPVDLKNGNNVWQSAYGPHSWDLRATATPLQAEPIVVPRGKAMGGSSSINGQVVFRGIPEDYDNWASWGNDEWAFTNILGYFRKMENDWDFPGGDFHGNDGPLPVRRYKREEWLPFNQAFYDACLALGIPENWDQNDPECNTAISPRPLNNIDGVRMSTSLTYLSQARHRLNITVRGNVAANRVLFDGKRAVGIQVESGGEVFNIEGDQIILCSGTIGSAQILLLSGVGPADHLQEMGIRQVHQLPGVGQNLRDHPAAYILFKGDRRTAGRGRSQHPGRPALERRRLADAGRLPDNPHVDDQRAPARQREFRGAGIPLRPQHRLAERHIRRLAAAGVHRPEGAAGVELRPLLR